MQRLEMAEFRQELAKQQSTAPGVDKVFLGLLEYNGESDFEDYLSQFEAMARTLCWSEDRKDSALYGRLSTLVDK